MKRKLKAIFVFEPAPLDRPGALLLRSTEILNADWLTFVYKNLRRVPRGEI